MELPELGEAAEGGSQSPVEGALRPERRVLLARALASLASEDREVLVLRDLEELTGEEAAAALGLSLAATKSRLRRARLRLAGHVAGCDACDRFERRFAGVIRDLREGLGEPEPLEAEVAGRLRARIAGL